MTLIFFQNCISPHQIPYIRECAKDKRIQKVFLCVPRTDYEKRLSMGWDSRKLLIGKDIICLVHPLEEQIKVILLTEKDCFCFFSGIRADAYVFQWFKCSLSFRVKRYIITEPPFIYNKPLWMHYVRFFIQDYRFVKYIDGIFGFGQAAVDYYRNISSHWKVFPFQYVTEHVARTIPVPQGKLKLLFVGSLSHRKNVKIALKALQGIDNVEFNIVGDGEKKTELKKMAKCLEIRSNFIGMKLMHEIPIIMQQNDVLILPSLHDGWGAVVNEAMTLGLYVIVSDSCGAKVLITDDEKGLVFKNNIRTDLKEKLSLCISHKETIRDNIERRISLSKSIQGSQVATYFVDCLVKE